ncbi:hypothetical protein [Rhodococcus sp. Q]|uniref:hypothetical protein n=1 Tax=Rhodococcus sp. Q TaxID=2502252 RepID=UPI0010F5C9AF|nr:hypothetical protein [Rhodococcus sp. Q]
MAFTEAIDRRTRQMKKALNSQHYVRPHDSLMAQIRSQVSASGGHDRLSALANAAAVSTPMGEASTPQNAMLHILLGRVATALSARDLIESSLFEAVVAPWRQVVHFGR